MDLHGIRARRRQVAVHDNLHRLIPRAKGGSSIRITAPFQAARVARSGARPILHSLPVTRHSGHDWCPFDQQLSHLPHGRSVCGRYYLSAQPRIGHREKAKLGKSYLDAIHLLYRRGLGHVQQVGSKNQRAFSMSLHPRGFR